mmetsp:Transcript_6026/g.10962  ORF Transcript_6026/g.10962 Transcript_6026/m.10962 type:complete len:145 (-) Transcript_6026:46-480(-)|eukprot:CAMPEP_0182496798 /NCGR_PEP_ID=MMETSP1321-20130603/5388_1 /TAXON_ID=91990 /ORGANISM="Bolidomonas sp., Strain RCC1657" /LENGTH=144 /DNA_ID=CAMNT_0024700489 /DNA_START=162 /DNA_END=596 /DNA_ORIENTATION=+
MSDSEEDGPVFTGGSLSFLKSEKKSKKKKKKSKKEKKEKTGKKEKRKLDDDAEQGSDEDNADDIAAASSKKQRTKDAVEDGSDSESDLTEFEKKHRRKRLEKERRDTEAVAKKSHRERIDDFNSHLGSLTELNDLPRISAAGNG